ncbi:MAG: hypothetical protein M1825_002170 [Sarcosagium campestre]|nr:MAG: hypothetical protein M1825_002170 [Sarcosagium campestre]
MPTELEELVDFLHHGNTQIRQIAAENLVGYSKSQPSVFKVGQLTPIKDLKLLVRDYAPIAQNAVTILINLSDDKEVLKNLVSDDAFLESLLARIVDEKEANANFIAMLLANLAKSDQIKMIMSKTRNVPKGLSTSTKVMDQLMDCFVKGAEGRYNKKADYDYLAYFFADIAKFPEGREYFVTEQEYDHVVPISKLVVFTEYDSDIRRRGIASAIKNVAFDVPSHSLLISESAVNLLPYILLPITGSEEYPDDESNSFPPDLQLLPPDKSRESDPTIINTHLETLLLLTTSREGRDYMRQINVYPMIRETHAHVDHEDVQDACDRLVQVLMRDEPEDPAAVEPPKTEPVPEDDDDKIIDVF